MADGRHFENRKIAVSRQRIDKLSRNLAGDAYDLLNLGDRENNEFLKKSKMADGRHFKNRKIAIYWQWFN